ALRKNSTEAERCLWSRLRGRRLEGIKFRRQQILGPYVVDFLCVEPKVVIEVDGGQHAEQVLNDLQRTDYPTVSGYRVRRFWNHEVLGDPEAVLESIRAALVEIPSPQPCILGAPNRAHPWPWLSPGGRGS
ncbi:MAG: endonuclease domain-containing protein, partial [Chromatiales bacterium]